MIKKIALVVFSAAGLCLTSAVHATEKNEKFDLYVAALKQEALAKGYSNDLIERAFATVHFKPKVVSADKNQPEVKETLETYLPKRVPQWKIDKARRLYQENKTLLEAIAKEYGVQARFIVALWGLESNFGKIQGNFPVVSSLVTLAFDGRREEMYKNQLWAALDILKEGHIDLEHFKGSWAGAMGQTQFMPTSFVAYAVDYDKDGKKDIWQNQQDAFASIANYLKQAGWNDNLTWGRQVQLPEGFSPDYFIKRGTKSRTEWLEQWKLSERDLKTWNELGLRRADGTLLPNLPLTAILVKPDYPDGRVYLAYDNYKALMHWNRSYYFATSVGYLSDRIAYPKI